MSFLIAKQPIFDRKGEIFAFEVFLRRKDNIYEYPKGVPYGRATYIIMEILLEQGLDRVGEGKRIMINVSFDSLANKSLEVFDPKKLIIELIEPQFILVNPEYESKAYLAGLFSLIDKILNVDKITFLEETKINQEIIDAYIGKNTVLGNILNYSVLLEEEIENLLGRENPLESENVIKLERQTGISRGKLYNIAKLAHSTADSLLKV